ncbi:acyltransferase [Dermabacteraceae bacterium TAE3-ERU27]|nr:acyltransferase [Dermabacteraceae bacterium TAE3-ERU27]
MKKSFADAGKSAEKNGSRYVWVDIIRGFMILVVVMFHVPAWIEDAPGNFLLGRLINRFFTPYMMPMMMILSGFFIVRSVEKPLKEYYVGKFRSIVWPYLVWQTIYLLVLISLSGNIEEVRPFIKYWDPVSYLWYLFFLSLMLLGAPLLRFVSGFLFLALFVAGDILTASQDWVFISGGIKTFMFFGVMFSFGALFGKWYPKISGLFAGWVARAFVVVTFMIGSVTVFWRGSYDKSTLLWLLLTLIGFVSMVGVTVWIQDLPFFAPIAWLGKNSLVLYVTHLPAGMLLGHLGSTTGITSRMPNGVAFCMLTAILVGVGVLFVAMRRLRLIDALFVGPRLNWGAQRHSKIV